MKAYEIYRAIQNKAVEVQEALHAVSSVHGDKSRWSADDLVDYFSTHSMLGAESDIRQDTRRHVKVLYADYCGLRDELIKLLKTDLGQAPVKPLKVELELPDGDSRSAKVQWSEMEGDILHLCISVTDRAP